MPKSGECSPLELAPQPAPSSSKSTVPRSYGQGSTGPRTPAGKAVLANQNLRHGLCSRRNVLPGEDPAEFASYRDALWLDLSPVGAVEEMLAERIVSSAWRLRRAVRVETEIMYLADEPRRMKAYLGPIKLAIDSIPVRLEHQLGVAFAASAAGVMDRLSRYEVTQERSLHRNLHELERLQSRRVGIPVLPPIAIDVDVMGCNFESQKPGADEAETADREESPDLVDEFRNGFASMRTR